MRKTKWFVAAIFYRIISYHTVKMLYLSFQWARKINGKIVKHLKTAPEYSTGVFVLRCFPPPTSYWNKERTDWNMLYHLAKSFKYVDIFLLPQLYQEKKGSCILKTCEWNWSDRRCFKSGSQTVSMPDTSINQQLKLHLNTPPVAAVTIRAVHLWSRLTSFPLGSLALTLHCQSRVIQ